MCITSATKSSSANQLPRYFPEMLNSQPTDSEIYLDKKASKRKKQKGTLDRKVETQVPGRRPASQDGGGRGDITRHTQRQPGQPLELPAWTGCSIRHTQSSPHAASQARRATRAVDNVVTLTAREEHLHRHRPSPDRRRGSYLDEVLPGREAGDHGVLPGLDVGDGHVQAAVGQLVSVGRQHGLHSASEGQKAACVIHPYVLNTSSLLQGGRAGLPVYKVTATRCPHTLWGDTYYPPVRCTHT